MVKLKTPIAKLGKNECNISQPTTKGTAKTASKPKTAPKTKRQGKIISELPIKVYGIKEKVKVGDYITYGKTAFSSNVYARITKIKPPQSYSKSLPVAVFTTIQKDEFYFGKKICYIQLIMRRECEKYTDDGLYVVPEKNIKKCVNNMFKKGVGKIGVEIRKAGFIGATGEMSKEEFFAEFFNEDTNRK